MAGDAGEMRRREQHGPAAAVAARAGLVDERLNQAGIIFQGTGCGRLLTKGVGLGFIVFARGGDLLALCRT